MMGMPTLNLSFLVQSIAIARPTIAHTALQQTAALRDFNPAMSGWGLPAIDPLNEAPHLIPPQIAAESYSANQIIQCVFTQPGSFSSDRHGRDTQGMSASPRKRTLGVKYAPSWDECRIEGSRRIFLAGRGCGGLPL